MKRTVTAEYVPAKRTRTRRNKRKQYIPKRITGGPSFNPVPDNIKVKMRYSQIVSLNPGGGITTYDSHIFRANSVYDPDYTGIGRKAFGLGLWDDVYSKYRVTGSRIKCEVANGQNTGVLFLCKSQSTTLTSSDPSTMLEKKGTTSSVLRLRDNSGVVWNKYSMNEDMAQASADWTATNSNPPTDEDWYYHICCATPTTGQVLVLVDIWYDVELSGRLTLVAS